MYVCNCNGIRERQVRAAIAAGASRPAEVFKAHQCRPQCARCVCDMRQMIDESREALRFAAYEYDILVPVERWVLFRVHHWIGSSSRS